MESIEAYIGLTDSFDDLMETGLRFRADPEIVFTTIVFENAR